MAFSRCPNCDYVQWQLGVVDGRPAGECPECSWEMQWTEAPVEPRTAMTRREREEVREAAGLRER